jgi:hypothetical protein
MRQLILCAALLCASAPASAHARLPRPHRCSYTAWAMDVVGDKVTTTYVIVSHDCYHPGQPLTLPPGVEGFSWNWLGDADFDELRRDLDGAL